jgi:hypothetical protein
MAARPILTLLLLSAVAHASPRSDPTAGRAVFTGATVPSASSISLNPAAIGLFKDTEFYVGVSTVLEQFGIDRRTIDLATGGLVPAERVRDAELGGGATLAVVWRAGDGVTLGFEFRSPPPELFPSDPALRYHTLGSTQRNYIATLGTSLRLTNELYFGTSLSHDNTLLHLRYARDTALDRGIDVDCGGSPCGFENPEAAETYDVDVRSPWVATDNLRVNIGFILKIANVWMGIAYHNTPGFGIQSSLTGPMTVTSAPRDGGQVINGTSTVYVSFPASVDAEVRALVLPDVELHVGARWEDLSRMQAYDVRGYGNALRGTDVPELLLRARGFHDVFSTWAGLEQIDTGDHGHWTDRFQFGGRIGFESSALDPDRISPENMAPKSFTVDGGMQVRLTDHAIVQLSYGLAMFPGVHVEHSAYDPRFATECLDSGFDYSTPACDALRNGYAIPTAAGDYTRFQHAIRLGLRYVR